MKEVPHHLYPFENNFFDLDGLRMHYLDEGRGEPVVAVHGNPSWSFYYRQLARSLRDEYRVIVPDHMGCGLSDKPGDDRYEYTLARRIEDFGRLMDDLGLEGINLVVHDWGGMIGFAWAVRNPERVQRLVILNTAAFHLPKTKAFPWQLWMVRDTPLGPLMVRGFNGFARGAARLACTRKKLSREVRDAYCAPYDSWADRIATLRFVQDIPLRPEIPGTTSSRTPLRDWMSSVICRYSSAGATRTSSLTIISWPSGSASTLMRRSTASPTAATTSSRTPPIK